MKKTIWNLKWSDLTWANIWGFFTGTKRYFEDKLDILPLDLRVQVEERIKLVEQKSPECLNGHCKHCGCSTPEKFYEDRGCEAGCYPPLKKN